MSAVPAPRVLLVTKGLDIGGIERIVVELALAMTKRGVPVEVAVVNDRRDQLVPLLTDAGIVVHRLGGSDRIGVSAARLLAGLVKDQRFDVVHVHGPLPGALARIDLSSPRRTRRSGRYAWPPGWCGASLHRATRPPWRCRPWCPARCRSGLLLARW